MRGGTEREPKDRSTSGFGKEFNEIYLALRANFFADGLTEPYIFGLPAINELNAYGLIPCGTSHNRVRTRSQADGPKRIKTDTDRVPVLAVLPGEVVGAPKTE